MFSLLVFPSNEIIIVDSHPLNEEVGGNGNGIIGQSLSKEKNIQLDNETCHAIQGVTEEYTCNDNFA